MKVVLCYFSLFDRQIRSSKQFTFEMESDQEFPSTFSKLNVNAVEFVPSFAATTAREPDAASEENAKPLIETPENNGNGEFYTRKFIRSTGEFFATSNVAET